MIHSFMGSAAVISRRSAGAAVVVVLPSSGMVVVVAEGSQPSGWMTVGSAVRRLLVGSGACSGPAPGRPTGGGGRGGARR